MNAVFKIALAVATVALVTPALLAASCTGIRRQATLDVNGTGPVDIVITVGGDEVLRQPGIELPRRGIVLGPVPEDEVVIEITNRGRRPQPYICEITYGGVDDLLDTGVVYPEELRRCAWRAP